MRPAADLLRPAVLLLLLDFSGGLTEGAIPELTPMVSRALGERTLICKRVDNPLHRVAGHRRGFANQES